MQMNEILISLRVEKGLKQVEVADAIHISSSAVSKYEIGRSLPEYDTLLKLADFYGVNLDYLFGRTSIRTPMKRMEGKLRTRSGTVPIDALFRLRDLEKETIGMMLLALSQRDDRAEKETGR